MADVTARDFSEFFECCWKYMLWVLRVGCWVLVPHFPDVSVRSDGDADSKANGDAGGADDAASSVQAVEPSPVEEEETVPAQMKTVSYLGPVSISKHPFYIWESLIIKVLSLWWKFLYR